MDIEKLTSNGAQRQTYTLGGGLYLTVNVREVKTWLYRRGGKSKTIGTYPQVSEKEAREWIGCVSGSSHELSTWANKYVAYLRKMERSEKTITQYEYFFSILSESFNHHNIRSLNDLKSQQIKSVFQWILANKTAYAGHGSYPLLSALYKFMIGSGEEIVSPFAVLKKAFVLESEYRIEGLTYIKKPERMLELVKRLKAVKNLPIAKNCILAIAYLPLRPMEMCRLKWDNVIKSGTVINIPPESNKTRKDLHFPVTKQLRDILQFQKEIGSGEYVFANRVGGESHIKRDALTRTIAQIGFEGQIDIHGLRHSFRTIADEHLNLDRLMLEVVLGHNVGTKIEKVYNGSTYMPQKMGVLTNWNNWLDGIKVI